MFKTLQHLGWLIVGLLAAFVLFHVRIVVITAENWDIVSQLPTRRWAFSTAVVDGKIYIIGGRLIENQNGPFGLSIVEVYDPRDNTWQRVADMPTPRASLQSAVVDGKIYVIGGYNGIDNFIVNMKTLKVLEMYDPQIDTWMRKQDLSVPRRDFSVGVVNRKIYAIGGKLLKFKDGKLDEPWRLDHMEVYDPVTDTWTARAKMLARRSGFETVVVNDSIYVLGGAGWPDDEKERVLTIIESYHPRTNQWKKKSDMPNLKTGFSTVVVADEIYLIGGHGGVKFNEYLATVEIYNPETEKWKAGVPMPTGNTPFGAAVVDGKIYILGSERENGELSLDIEVFDTGFRAVTAKNKLTTRWGALKTERESQP